jgi:hypothetical protein
MEDDDWGTFMDPADFAHAFAWESTAEFVEGYGLFNAAHEVALSGEFGGVSTRQPVLTVAESHMPTDAAQGDEVECKGRNWRVADIQPDGSGLARVILERS